MKLIVNIEVRFKLYKDLFTLFECNFLVLYVLLTIRTYSTLICLSKAISISFIILNQPCNPTSKLQPKSL